jgi:hypothetical protein
LAHMGFCQASVGCQDRQFDTRHTTFAIFADIHNRSLINHSLHAHWPAAFPTYMHANRYIHQPAQHQTSACLLNGPYSDMQPSCSVCTHVTVAWPPAAQQARPAHTKRQLGCNRPQALTVTVTVNIVLSPANLRCYITFPVPEHLAIASSKLLKQSAARGQRVSSEQGLGPVEGESRARPVASRG